MRVPVDTPPHRIAPGGAHSEGNGRQQIVLILSLACSFAACAQSSIPMAPVPQAPSAPAQASPLEPDGQATPITRGDAERMALKNNPRITASHLLALAPGQGTRDNRSNELSQVNRN